jgi:putative PIN family toxin of toxin-antitoxin system
MKFVLDTSVYIAAFLNKGLASNILLLGKQGAVKLYISPEIQEEVEEILAWKFKVDNYQIMVFMDLVLKSTKKVIPQQVLNVIKADPDDNKILECTVEAQADLIISMDKHLIKLKKYKRIGIVHPKTLTWIIPKLL